MSLLKISRFPDFSQRFPDFSLTKFFKVRKCERCGSLNPRLYLYLFVPLCIFFFLFHLHSLSKAIDKELTVPPEHHEILSIMQNKHIKLRAANQPTAPQWKFFFYAKQVCFIFLS